MKVIIFIIINVLGDVKVEKGFEGTQRHSCSQFFFNTPANQSYLRTFEQLSWTWIFFPPWSEISRRWKDLDVWIRKRLKIPASWEESKQKKINSRKCCAAKWKMTETNNIQSYDMQIRKMHLHIKLARWSKIVTNVCTEVSDLKIKAKKKRGNEVEKWHRVCSINEIIFASVKTTS